VIARIVAQRTNEIGIRMALGAQVGQIARLILGAGMRMVFIGTALGLLGASGWRASWAAPCPGFPATASWLSRAPPAVLIAVALLACWLPARRATKVDPMVALRAE